MTVSSLTKQLFVAVSPPLAALSVGGAFTFPSILLQQLSGNDSSITLDLDTASWIGSIHGIAGIPSIFLPVIMQWRGRKFAFIIACLISIIGWILSITARSSLTILISESFQGLGNTSLLAVSLLSMSEMVAPRIRNVSMIFYSLAQGFGMTMCGILGRYLHWKTVSMILTVPIVVAMLMGFMWPESPSWLAYKGEFEKCKQSFIWLRGIDEQSTKELRELISAQEATISNRKKTGSNYNLRTLLYRDFYLPCFHMFVLLCLVYLSGSIVVFIYSVKMIESATYNEDAAFYGTIFVNSVNFVGVGMSVLLIRRFTNKSILISSTIGTVLSLLCSSLSVYLHTIGILSKDSLIGLYFLIVYVLCVSMGVIPVVFTVAAELMPVKHRGQGGVLYIIFTSVLHSVTLKAAPYLFIYINFWGTLLLYAVNSTICGLYIWKYVPETKGKTLQELENYYTRNKTGVSDDLPDHLNLL